MSRRGYPILGRLKLNSLEVNTSALKPVYLNIKILEVDLRTSLRARPGAVPGPDPGPDPGQIQGQIEASWIPVSQILVIIPDLLVKRPYEPN